jgi:outer membrane protein insertion porin family
MQHLPGRSLPRSAIAAVVALLTAIPGIARAQDTECDGRHREVLKLAFEGNASFKDDELATRINTTESSRLRRLVGIIGTRRCLPDEGLKPDIENLRNFYKTYGFFQTTVDTVVNELRPDAVSVIFQVDEGKPVLVDTLVIAGLDSVPNRADVVRDLKLGVGRRYGIVPLYADIDSITTRLRNSGYPMADVVLNISTHATELRAEVRLTFIPGPLARFGAVTVASADTAAKLNIPPKVVAGLLGFSAGDRYSDRAVTTAQRNLYQTGAYVAITTAIDTAGVSADSVVDVHVALREDLLRQVDSELGWGTVDCFRTNVQYTDKNLLSQAHHFELNGRLSKIGFASPTNWSGTRQLCQQLKQDSAFSSRVNYYAGATVRQSTLFGARVSPAYSLYTERRGEWNAYLRTTNIGGLATVSTELRSNTPLRLGYSLEYGHTEAQPAVYCATFSLCDQESQRDKTAARTLAVASASMQRLRTDNAIDPRHGTVLRAEVRSSAPFIGSDATLKFAKGTIDAAWYRPLAPRTVLALRFRAGIIGATGGGFPPPQERLYAGGASTIRGFQQNQVGRQIYLVDTVTFVQVDDSTRIYSIIPGVSRQVRPGPIPVGGNSLLIANLELRLRDPFIPKILQYSLFLDAGQVWTRQVGVASPGLSKTPGVGARLFTPIGPIQVNLAYNKYNLPGGQALFSVPAARNGGSAALFCVSPSATPIPVHLKTGTKSEYEQGPGSCPSTYAPTQAATFLKRLNFTLSIGTDF